jgi:hypothetical protein
MLIALGVIGVVLVFGVVFTFFPNPPVDSAAIPPEWPPFEMVYKDWGIQRATNGSKENGGFVLVKLTYFDRYNYSIKVLEDTSMPAVAGSRASFSPNQILSYDARTGEERTIPIPSGESYRADDILEPGLVNRWISQYDAVVRPTETEGLNEMTYSEQVPCDPEVLKCENKFLNVETYVKYWAENDVPMELKIIRDGVLRRHWTVTDFRWLEDGNR